MEKCATLSKVTITPGYADLTIDGMALGYLPGESSQVILTISVQSNSLSLHFSGLPRNKMVFADEVHVANQLNIRFIERPRQ